MSIASEIERIKSAKEALKTAINARGGNLNSELLDDYATAVSNLPTGSDIDVSFVTATADDILAGKVGVDAEGNPITGTIETVTASLSGNVVTVPAGHIASEQTLTVTEAKAPTVSGNVVTVYPGYQAQQTTATVATAKASLSANVVTVPAGYHSAQTLTVAEASEPTVSGNEVTVYKGYQAAENKITVGTAKSAETFTPGTADKTLTAGLYLSGTQTIKGDANLLAENIKAGVTIFGITGTYEGECGDGGSDSGGGESDGTGYDYDKLEVSLSGKPLYSDISVLNGTYTRITTTDDATLQANGFQTEQWQSDGEPTVTLSYVNNYWQFTLGASLVECTSTTSNLSAPWEETVGWDGDTILSVTGTITKMRGDNSDTPIDKTPVYRVTHMGNGAEVGDYWDSGQKDTRNQPIYTNGVCYLGFNSITGRSYIRDTAEFDGEYSSSAYLWISMGAGLLDEGQYTGDYEPGSSRSFPYANVAKL